MHEISIKFDKETEIIINDLMKSLNIKSRIELIRKSLALLKYANDKKDNNTGICKIGDSDLIL